MMNKNLTKAVTVFLLLGGTTVWAASADDFKTDEYFKSGGLDIIRAADAYALGYSGKGVTLGICDTPVNFAVPEFSDKTNSQMINFAATDIHPDQPGVYDWAKLAHGTHVAGIAAASKNSLGMHGVAYAAEVAGSNMGSLYNLSTGAIDDSADLYGYYLEHPEIKILNNSWTDGESLDTLGLIGDGKSDQVIREKILQNDTYQQIMTAARQDKLLVFSTGNVSQPSGYLESTLGLFDAGAAHNLISVTALQNNLMTTHADGSISSPVVVTVFSNLTKYSEDQALAAPGYEILSANANYEADGKLDIPLFGTSMAAPFVTGAGAVVQEAFPYMTAKQLGDVLLSTANNRVTADPGYVIVMDRTAGQVSVYYTDTAVTEKSPDKLKADVQAYIDQAGTDYQTYLKNHNYKWETYTITPYYQASMQELIGQGILDAGAAVQGLGALNARRLTTGDISDAYMVQGQTTRQALYGVDTQGYYSVWSNNIGEVRAGLLAADSTETDLRERYVYYHTNWLSHPELSDYASTKYYVDTYMKM